MRLIYGVMRTREIMRPIINLPIAGMKIELPGGSVVLEAGLVDVVGTIPESGDPATNSSRTLTRVIRIGNYAAQGNSSAGIPAEKKWREPRRPPDRAVFAEVSTREEKGTDVNFAVHLVNDAAKDRYDRAIIASNDTDFAGAIKMVRSEHGKEVCVLCPARTKVADRLKKAADKVLKVEEQVLKDSQLPDRIPGTSISIPREYKRALADAERLWSRRR